MTFEEKRTVLLHKIYLYQMDRILERVTCIICAKDVAFSPIDREPYTADYPNEIAHGVPAIHDAWGTIPSHVECVHPGWADGIEENHREPCPTCNGEGYQE